MRAVILPGGRPTSCYPLTVERDLGACVAANRPLRQAQAEELAAAGLRLGEAGEGEGGLTLWLPGNAWVPAAELAALAVSGLPGCLRRADGELLAYLATAAEPPTTTSMVSQSRECLIMRYPWDFLALNEQLLGRICTSSCEGDVRPGATVDGLLVLGAGSRLLPGVYIEGTVMIGRDCKIGPNCYLRGPIAIGDRCHVGQSVEVKASILMNGAAVGHLSYVGDSIVGEKANFGAGTITANFRHDGKSHRSMVDGQLMDTGRRKFGAIIGDHVHTGIHTSIYPGRKIWPHLSTLPGAIVSRDLTDTPSANG